MRNESETERMLFLLSLLVVISVYKIPLLPSASPGITKILRWTIMHSE